VIYGATSSGIAAAVQVSRMGKSVLIVDPGTHIGGLTTGGLGWTDIGNKQVIGGIAREFYRKVKAHYDQPASWRFQARESYYSLRHAEINAGDDAMWTFEPKVATAIYQEMIAQYKIPVVLKQRLDLRPGKGVIKTGARITAIVMEDGTRYTGRMFIDATYEGDLMAKAGVKYTIGREAKFGLRREVQRRGSGASSRAPVSRRTTHLSLCDTRRPGQRSAPRDQRQGTGSGGRGRPPDPDLLLPAVHD
jgi:hypothetical protein